MMIIIYQGEWFKDYYMNAFKFEWSDPLILEKVEQMDEHFGLLKFKLPSADSALCVL